MTFVSVERFGNLHFLAHSLTPKTPCFQACPQWPAHLTPKSGIVVTDKLSEAVTLKLKVATGN